MTVKNTAPKAKGGAAARHQAILQWGPEPEFAKDRPPTQSEIATFCTWHHYVTDRSEGLSWLMSYLSASDGRRHEKVRRVRERRIVDSFFWQARLLSKGYPGLESLRDRFNVGLDELATRVDDGVEVDEDTGEVTVPAAPEPKKPSPKAVDALEKAYEFLDANDPKASAYQFLIDEEVPRSAMAVIVTTFGPRLEELQGCLDRFDSETRHYLNDFRLDTATKAHDRKAYAVEKEWLRTHVAVIGNLVSDASRFLDNAKKARKPRKKKVLSVEKRLSRLKYQREDADSKLVSVDPSKLLGCQEAWLYNTRYNFLSVYRAGANTGLDIRGTSVIGYDDKASYYKRLGRSPDKWTTAILASTKSRLKRTMDEIGAEAQSVNGRINENTIILRVV